jgi:hypothetical protein
MPRMRFSDSRPVGRARVLEPAAYESTKHGLEEALDHAKQRSDQILAWREACRKAFQNGR